MAQGHERKVLQAFNTISESDRYILTEELAMTGCKDQAYTLDVDLESTHEGPAFLVYYAPALLQRNCGESATFALSTLAEVLRQARALWPLEDHAGDTTIIIRIDAIKELDVSQLTAPPPPGMYWAIQRTSNKDAQVQLIELAELTQKAAKVLSFAPPVVMPRSRASMVSLNVAAGGDPQSGAESPPPPRVPRKSMAVIEPKDKSKVAEAVGDVGGIQVIKNNAATDENLEGEDNVMEVELDRSWENCRCCGSPDRRFARRLKV
jgi:hypothetical protein